MIGNYYINKKGTIGKIMRESPYLKNEFIMRRISLTVGSFTDRVGTPYTFQSFIRKETLNKSWKLISTEKILRILQPHKNELNK